MKTTVRSFFIVGLIFSAAWALNVRLQWRSEPLIEATDAWSQGEVWIEFVIIDGQWAGSGGVTGGRGELPGGYTPPKELGPPQSGGSTSNSPRPVPTSVIFQWFNFSQQRYYEAVIDDPEMPRRAKEFALSQRDWRRFEFSLVYDFSTTGIVRLWLYGTDYYSATWGLGESHCYELLGSVQGYEIEGNPKKFKSMVRQSWLEGGIPIPPDPAPAATQPRRESVFWAFLKEKEKLYGQRP